jgi:hypothetical protein
MKLHTRFNEDRERIRGNKPDEPRRESGVHPLDTQVSRSDAFSA